MASAANTNALDNYAVLQVRAGDDFLIETADGKSISSVNGEIRYHGYLSLDARAYKP